MDPDIKPDFSKLDLVSFEWKDPAGKVVSNYLNADGNKDSLIDFRLAKLNRSGNKKAEFLNISLHKDGAVTNTRFFSVGDALHIRFTLKVNNANETAIKTSVELKTSDGFKIANKSCCVRKSY